MSKAAVRIFVVSLRNRPVVVGNMAAQCSLSTLFPIQSQLDFDLDDATTQQEKEDLVLQYLKKLDEREDLKIPDFQTGKTPPITEAPQQYDLTSLQTRSVPT